MEHTALFDLIAKNAAQVEMAMRTDLDAAMRSCDPLLAEVLAYALLGGGKRLRPLLTMLSSRLCGKEQTQTLDLLAVAFEYLHTATLIHDDVLDHAKSRRGRESVVSRYGLSTAILVGDWLHARSMYLIGELAGQKGLELFCTATAEMVDGEFLQMRSVADLSVSEAQYLAVISKKTAGLISAACAVGALHGQGSPEQVAALAEYGKKIGLAFQIVDDLLDYLGEEQATGKKLCNDLLEGKMTLPLIHALSHAEGQERDLLVRSVANNRSETTSCVPVKQLLDQLGSFAYCRQRAREEVRAGLTTLACFQQQEDVDMLRNLANYVLSRDR